MKTELTPEWLRVYRNVMHVHAKPRTAQSLKYVTARQIDIFELKPDHIQMPGGAAARILLRQINRQVSQCHIICVGMRGAAFDIIA